MPPSSDMGKSIRTQSLRKPSGKKPGGQPGRKGTTLKMTDTPDHAKDYLPMICKHCGNSLSEVEADFAGRRQLIDLPPDSSDCYRTQNLFQAMHLWLLYKIPLS